MDFDKIVTIQLSFCILLVALATWRFVKSWSHPAVVFTLFWFVMTFFPLTIMWSVDGIDYYGTAYILAATIAFAAPSFFMDWNRPVQVAKARAGEVTWRLDIWLPVFYALVAATFICIVVNLFIQDLSLLEIVSHPMRSAADYMARRYESKVVVNVFSQIGGVLNYVAACLGGLIIADQKAKPHIIAVSVLSFFPSLLYIILYSDKGALFLAAAYFYGALLVSRINRGDLALVTKIDVKAFSLALVVLIPILIFGMLSRGGWEMDSASEKIDSVVLYIDSYGFAHLYAFSDWIDHYLGSAKGSYADNTAPRGFWTFMAIGKLLHPDVSVPIGYFTEMYDYKTLIHTNIYTMFRGLIYDFTIPGSFAFMAMLGWLGALAYRQMLLFTRSPISQAFYIFLFGFIYSSFLLSLLTWASAYAVAGCVTLILLINDAIRPHAVGARATGT